MKEIIRLLDLRDGIWMVVLFLMAFSFIGGCCTARVQLPECSDRENEMIESDTRDEYGRFYGDEDSMAHAEGLRNWVYNCRGGE